MNNEDEVVDMSHCTICGEHSTDRKRMIIETTVCSKCYDKIKDNDIENLRQKLIENLCGELISGVKPSSCDDIPQESILETINKYFGVKE